MEKRGRPRRPKRKRERKNAVPFLVFHSKNFKKPKSAETAASSANTTIRISRSMPACRPSNWAVGPTVPAFATRWAI